VNNPGYDNEGSLHLRQHIASRCKRGGGKLVLIKRLKYMLIFRIIFQAGQYPNATKGNGAYAGS